MSSASPVKDAWGNQKPECCVPRSSVLSGHHSLFSVHMLFPQVRHSFTGSFRNENAEFTESLLCSLFPGPPILVLRFSLLFLCVFPLFSRDFKCSAEREILVFFRGVLAFLPKKKGLEGQGSLSKFTGEWFTNHSNDPITFTYSLQSRESWPLRFGLPPKLQMFPRPLGWAYNVFPRTLLLVELNGLTKP